MNYPKPIRLKEISSTSLYMSQLCDRQKQADFTCVCSDYQTAGRGQRGNGWESEAGKNLLFSFVLYPDSLEASRQFVLSQITALALQETLAQYADDITVKWPNDIYWKDRKLCGTLIENDLTGLYVSRSISGTGVNLNQERFLRPIRFRCTRLRAAFTARKKCSARYSTAPPASTECSVPDEPRK